MISQNAAKTTSQRFLWIKITLIGGIVDVTGGVGSVTDGQDVAVLIVGIRPGYIIIIRGLGPVCCHLRGGLAVAGIAVGEAFLQHIQAGAGVPEGLAGNTVVDVVLVKLLAVAFPQAFQSSVFVVFEAFGSGTGAEGFHPAAQPTIVIVSIGQRQVVIPAGFPVLGRPVDQVVGIPLDNTGFRIDHSGQFAAVAVPIGNLRSVLVGFPGHLSPGIVLIYYTILIAVVKGQEEKKPWNPKIPWQLLPLKKAHCFESSYMQNICLK